MRDFILRPWRPEDRPALKELWRAGFGDSDEFIETFFDLFLREDACVTAEADGRVVAAMYILPVDAVLPRRKKLITARYTYALATLPEYRGLGIGRAVYRAASDKALETAGAACVLPAEESLYPFYEDASGARPVSFLRQARLARADLAGTAPCMAARIPTLEYAAIREQLLAGFPHAALPQEYFDLMEAADVEFFVLENGLAAAERSDGVCRVLELLDPDTDAMSSIAGVARWCPAAEYIVRTPLFFEGPGEARPYMLAALKEEPPYSMPEDLWWGFGLE